MIESIECAAVKYQGKVYAFERPNGRCRVLWQGNAENNVPCMHNITSGFLTSKGRFLNREDAEVLARKCGQLTGDIIGEVLTSEDLW